MGKEYHLRTRPTKATPWKMSKYGDFPGPYFSVFSPNIAMASCQFVLIGHRMHSGVIILSC